MPNGYFSGYFYPNRYGTKNDNQVAGYLPNPLPKKSPLSNFPPQAGERANEKGNLQFLRADYNRGFLAPHPPNEVCLKIFLGKWNPGKSS